MTYTQFIIISAEKNTEVKPKIVKTEWMSNVLYISWNATNIPGIVFTIVVVKSADNSTVLSRAVANWSTTDINVEINNCKQFEKIAVTVEVYNECQEIFASKPMIIQTPQSTPTTPSSTSSSYKCMSLL